MKKVLFAILPVIAAVFTACPQTTPGTLGGEAPVIVFASDLETLPSGGGTITLSWTVQNATKVSIDGGVGTVPMAGLKTMKLTSSKTYTLTAQGSSGPSTQSVSIKVTETPVVTPPAQPRISANLIQNPGAEASVGSDNGFPASSIPKWIRDTATGYPAIIKYGAVDQNGYAFVSQTDPGPTDRGDNFFAGGYSNTSYNDIKIRQQIKLAADWLEATDTENVQFELEGWFGGYLSEYDTAFATVEFQDVNGNKLGSASTSEVFPSDRNNKTGLVRRATKGDFPQGTRSIQAELHMFNYGSLPSYNDGYADNLSFKLKEKK